MHTKVLSYLRSRPCLDDPVVKRLLAKLQEGRSLVERAQTLHLQELLRARLLASTSLLENQEACKQWDEANLRVTHQLARGTSLSLSSIRELHQSLTGSYGQFRTRRAFGEQNEYLPPDFFGEAVRILEQDILEEPEALTRAARVYIWVATVHPFEDGNGRTARLSADWILLQQGWLPLSFQSGYLSRVAQQLTDRTRDLTRSFLTFLNGVENSYVVALGKDWNTTG